MKLAAANPHGNEYAQSLRRRNRNAVPGVCKCCVFGKSQSYLTLGLRPFQVLFFYLFLLAKWFTAKWDFFEALLSVYKINGSLNGSCT